MRMLNNLIISNSNPLHPEFYTLLTLHPGMILVNTHFNSQFFMYVYLYSVHVSGSHVYIIRRIIVSMRHLVYITLCRIKALRARQSDINQVSHCYNNSPDDGHMSARNIFIHSLVFSPRGRSGRNQSPFMEPIWFLALHPRHILGDSLPLLFPPLEVPTFATTCLCVLSERWNCGRERCPVVILPKFRLPRKFRDLFHAANLRHGTDGFTSPPKEGVLRTSSP